MADRCPTYSRPQHATASSSPSTSARPPSNGSTTAASNTTPAFCLEPSLLRAGTLDAAARTRVIHCRRTDTALPGVTPAMVPRNAEPTIEIRELRISSSRSSETGTGLMFHTVDDANVALHALADAQEAFQSTFGPDPASAVSGADTVVVYRALYTTVYRLDHCGADGVSRPAPAALAG